MEMRWTLQSPLAWYLRRAAAMSVPELAHRLREQVRRNLSRRDRRGWRRFEFGAAPLTPLHGLADRMRRPWPPAVEEAVGLSLATDHPLFLGQAWPATDLITPADGLWLTDPVTGEKWPGVETFCFDVRWRREQRKSDVKFVLELNRLQWLHTVAAMAIRRGDAAQARAAAGALLSWMSENPPFRGLNWLSGIELALRLVSISFVVTALYETAPNHEFHARLRSLVAAHAYWLHRFPSLHSSANNHLVAEGLGLLVAAAIAPDLPEADHYRDLGRTILTKAAWSQFHDDGTGMEQSPTYAAFTLELILFGIMLGPDQGISLSPELSSAIRRGAQHLRALLDEGGRHPRIGDDDEGRVIAMPPLHEDRYVASVVAAAAGVIGRPDLAPPGRAAHLRDLLFDSPEQPGSTAEGVLCFREGGYTVVRESMGGRKVLLVMDHGPLGFGSLAAHGHADALSIWLHLDDQPVFVDAGTYRYNASGDWRERLRTTQAHNTLIVEGASQSISAGAFNWGHKARAELVALDTSDSWRIEAVHDGYLKRFGVVHRRLCCRERNGFLIEDSIVPAARLGAEINFLLHPALSVTRSGSAIIIWKGDDALIRLSSQKDALITIVSESVNGVPPVYSSAYNVLQPTTRISVCPADFLEPHTLRVEIFDRNTRKASDACVASAPLLGG